MRATLLASRKLTILFLFVNRTFSYNICNISIRFQSDDVQRKNLKYFRKSSKIFCIYLCPWKMKQMPSHIPGEKYYMIYYMIIIWVYVWLFASPPLYVCLSPFLVCVSVPPFVCVPFACVMCFELSTNKSCSMYFHEWLKFPFTLWKLHKLFGPPDFH